MKSLANDDTLSKPLFPFSKSPFFLSVMSNSTTPHESADLIDSLPYIDRDLEDQPSELNQRRFLRSCLA